MRDSSAGEAGPHGVVTADVLASTDRRWATLVADRPSQVFHSPAWMRSLEDGYGLAVRAHLLLDGAGRPAAGIPYVDVSDVRGLRRICLPFSDFCDPIGDDPGRRRLLMQSLLAPESRTVLRLLHAPAPPPEQGWEETGSFAWHRVDVSRPEEEAWEFLPSSARRAIRKATAAGVEVVAASTESDLRRFFELHLRVRKHKYGLLAQPYRFFEAIWQHFLAPDQGVLLLARAGSQIVGGVLYLRWRDTLYYKFNASDQSQLEVRPNDLLAWEGMRHARRRGLRWFDFGVSDWDQEGLVRYKRKYATEEATVRRYSAGPVGEDPVGPILGQLTGLLTDPTVPDAVTERAGDLLYRYFC